MRIILTILFLSCTIGGFAHDAPSVTIEALSAQLQADPTQAHLWYHRAQLQEEAGQLEAALKDCKAAIQKGLNKPYARCKKLELLIALNRLQETPEILFQELRYQSPCEGLMAAQILLKKEQPQEAQHTIHQRVLPFPLNSETFHETVTLLINIDPSDASNVLQKHLREGRDLQAFLRLLDLHADQPNISLEHIKTFAPPYGDTLSVVQRHAKLLAQTGQHKKAIQRYEQALGHLNKQPAHRKHSKAFIKTKLDLRNGLSNLLKTTHHEPLSK